MKTFLILQLFILMTVEQTVRAKQWNLEDVLGQLAHVAMEKEIENAEVQNTGMTVYYAYYGQSCASSISKSNQQKSTAWAKSLCDGKTSCSGKVHTSVLTDPYHGCQKDFLVIAECPNGKITSDLVPKEAQGKSFKLSCPGMTVLYAYYGQSCTSSIDKTNQERTTKWAKSLCDGKTSCSGRISVSVLTDPYGGCPKDFIVVAECPGGQIIANLVTKEANTKSFKLNCPTTDIQ